MYIVGTLSIRSTRAVSCEYASSLLVLLLLFLLGLGVGALEPVVLLV